MRSRAEIEGLEKMIGQLSGLHSELSLLAKRAPNDAVNKFKLEVINAALRSANLVLTPNYLPLAGFEGFDADDLPSNSDVTLVLAQYMQEAERYRSDNVETAGGRWYYVVKGKLSEIRTGAPTKVDKR